MSILAEAGQIREVLLPVSKGHSPLQASSAWGEMP